MAMTRREMLRYGGAGGLAAAGFGTAAVVERFLGSESGDSYPAAGRDTSHRLVAREREMVVRPQATGYTPAWTYEDDRLITVLRGRQGEPMMVGFKNELPVPTTLHHHGIRLPNPMDGVPLLTQDPIASGEAFDYDFTPPDAGSYLIHTHVDSLAQLRRGMIGVAIIDEA